MFLLNCWFLDVVVCYNVLFILLLLLNYRIRPLLASRGTWGRRGGRHKYAIYFLMGEGSETNKHPRTTFMLFTGRWKAVDDLKTPLPPPQDLSVLEAPGAIQNPGKSWYIFTSRCLKSVKSYSLYLFGIPNPKTGICPIFVPKFAIRNSYCGFK